jgi:hypothetical protein
MLNDIVQQLKILSNNKIDDISALNVLHAKLNHLFSFKGIKFVSVNNPNKPTVLSYYGFNFVQSGGVKDKLANDIDLYLLSFFDNYINSYNKQRLEAIELEHIRQLGKIEDKTERNRLIKDQSDELKRFKKLHKKITNATMSSLYESAQMIEQSQSGSLMFQNTEFVVFFKDIVVNRDKTKGEFLDTLYGLYDGYLSGTNTTTTERGSIKDIALSCLFMSSPKILEKSEKMTDEFKDVLEQGIARRSFVYYDKNKNYYKEGVKYASYEEKIEAITKLNHYSSVIEQIFNNLQDGTVFEFSTEANKESIKWAIEADERCSKFYTFSDTLRDEENILCINLGNSNWKITKLAVLYHILNGGGGLVSENSFKKVSLFFEKTHKCLENLLNNKSSTDYENLYNYLVQNRNTFISKMELRKQKFVKWKDFSNWFKECIPELQEMCKKNGLCIGSTCTGERNQGYEITVFDPEKFNYNVIETDKEGNVIRATLTNKNKIGLIEVDTIC